MFKGEACVACERAMEPEMPSVDTTNPLYAAATSHPKSISMRLAISLASSAEITSPRPQFNHDAVNETSNVRETADSGCCGIAASFLKPRSISGALARAYPVVSIMTIWNAKLKILENPPYQEAAIIWIEPLGATCSASTNATKVKITAKT